LDFNNKTLHVFELFGLEIWITQTIVSTWIIMAALIFLAILVRILLRRFKTVPSGFQNAIELAVEAFGNIVNNAAGENYAYLGNWFFAVFAFILFSNLSGVFGLRPPTADFATTFALALATFAIVQAMGIRQRRGKYLKSFFQPIFLFFPLNLLGELARPISLSFRLFGNVLAGLILTGLLYSLPIYLRFIIPAAAHAIFDVFFGALQTYVFCILSLSFIGSAVKSPEKA